MKGRGRDDLYMVGMVVVQEKGCGTKVEFKCISNGWLDRSIFPCSHAQRGNPSLSKKASAECRRIGCATPSSEELDSERPMDDDDQELRNPFPSPPSHYTNFTTHNLNLLALLKERAGEETVDEHHVLADQSNLPPWSLRQLEKPRVDWILEDGQYTVFGDTWFV